MYSDDDVEKPRTFDKDIASAPTWAKPDKKCHFKMAQYHGMMKCIDDNVGRLIAALKEKNLYDNTILIFTADHGDMRGEHHRQNKGVPMEASAKIPFLIRWPEKLKAGRRIDHAMNTCDFMPTILSLMGAELSGAEEGRDLSKVFTGGRMKKNQDVTFMRSTTKEPENGFGWVAAVSPTHKLILSAYEPEPWLLDLEQDPDELQNFATDPAQKETLQFLARKLQGYGEAHQDPQLSNEKITAMLAKIVA